MNISMTTKIKNLEKTGCSRMHIEHCLNNSNLHEKPKYNYFGKSVSRGTILLHTCKGDFTLKFDEKDGWARTVEII